MDFSNVKMLDKGTVRKSREGATRESNFDFRFANYTKQTKAGDVVISQFAFTEGAMKKYSLEDVTKGAAPFVQDGIVGIAVVDADNAVFLGAPRKGELKARNVSVPSLVAAMAESGLVDTTFQGSQYFNLKEVGQHEGVVYFEIVKADIPSKPYNPREAKEDVEVTNPSQTTID